MSDTSLPVIFRFDTTANRMAFTPTPGVPEQLYIWLDSDDEPNAYYWDGSAWALLNGSSGVITEQIGITVDGGGSVLTTGQKGYKSFPVAGTITGWRLLADAAGDIEFDIFKDPFASFPPTTSIVAAAPPELVGVDSDEDTTLTGWTTSVSAGDVFGFEITGVPDTITRVTLELTITVP